MKNARPQTTEASALDKRNSNSGLTAKFSGTDNPRHLRAIRALQCRPQPRGHLDDIAGCANTPELIAELRRKGLTVPCQMVADIDRDGRPIRRGVYHFIKSDHKKINDWLRARSGRVL